MPLSPEDIKRIVPRSQIEMEELQEKTVMKVFRFNKAWAALIGGAIAEAVALATGLGPEWQAATTTGIVGLLVFLIPNVES